MLAFLFFFTGKRKESEKDYAFNYSTQNGFSSNLNFTMDKQLADRKAKQDASFEKEQAEKEEAEQKAKEAQKENGANVIEGVAIAVSEEEGKIQLGQETMSEDDPEELPRITSNDTAPDQSSINRMPELEAIVKQLKPEIDKAWEDSNPDGKEDHPLNGKKEEKGFWIYQENESAKVSVRPLEVEEVKKDQIKFKAAPVVEGQTVIALFHTHPNTMKEKDQNGKYYSPKPSYDDALAVISTNKPLIVKSHYGVYYEKPYNYVPPKVEKAWYKFW